MEKLGESGPDTSTLLIAIIVQEKRDRQACAKAKDGAYVSWLAGVLLAIFRTTVSLDSSLKATDDLRTTFGMKAIRMSARYF